jgi:hypothetical protein
MPAFEPTAKDRETVERVAGFGLPHEDICQLVINPRTGKAISRNAALPCRRVARE